MDESRQVFLSYHSADREAARDIALELRSQGLSVWFDDWDLIAGEPFQPNLAGAIRGADTIAVLIGPGAAGPWQSAEVQVAVNRQIQKGGNKGKRVIPVLLPGGKREQIPDFLEINTPVAFPSTKDPEALRRLIAAIEGRRPGPSADEIPIAGENPYRGLEPFLFEHARSFAGRDAIVATLVTTVNRYVESGDPALLGILGDSGTGKSSLARAGLLPALARGGAGEASWRHAEFKPGASPLQNLALTLLTLEGGATDLLRTGKLKRRLAEDRAALSEAISSLLAQTRDGGIALLVDQFDETFSLCQDAKERDAFVGTLVHAASVAGGRALIVVTLRTDFYGACAKYPDFGPLLNRQHVLVGPMGREELTAAIEQPALRAGYEMEAGLAAVLLRDAEDQPGCLPLLEFALDELWHRRTGRRMTLQAYEQLGGLSGALNHRADELFDEMSAEQQAAVRKIMLRLVQIGDDGRLLRTRVPVEDLWSAARPGQAEAARVAVERLSSPRSRLLTITASTGEGPSYAEVAHEALIRSWKKVADWLNEGSARQFVLWRQRFQEWEANWRESGESPDACLRGPILQQAVRYLQERQDEFTEGEARFIAISRDTHAAGLSVSRRRRVVQWTLAAACAAALGALVLVIVRRPAIDSRIQVARDLLGSNPDLAMTIALRANLARQTDDTVAVLQDAFQAATAAPIVHGSGPLSAIAFSVDGNQVATGASDGTAALWTVDRRLMDLTPAGSAVLAVSAPGNAVAAVTAQGTVRRITAPGGGVAEDRSLGSPLLAAAFSATGDVAAVTANNRVCIWRVNGSQAEHCQPVAAGATVVALGGDRVAVAGQSRECVIFDARSGVRLLLPLRENIVASAMFDGAAKVLATAASVGPVRMWDAASGSARGEPVRPNGQNVNYAALSVDGTRLATANVDGTIAIWSVDRGSTQWLWHSPHAPPARLAFSPRGERLAVADISGKVRIYELDSTEMNRVACRQEWEVRNSPDARFLADCPRYLNQQECALDCRPGLQIH